MMNDYEIAGLLLVGLLIFSALVLFQFDKNDEDLFR